mgnify:CR=1 FL=1
MICIVVQESGGSTLLRSKHHSINALVSHDGSTVEFRTGSVTFIDGLNLTTAMIANDALLEAMADYLSKQDADTLARFVHLFSPRVLEAQA